MRETTISRPIRTTRASHARLGFVLAASVGLSAISGPLAAQEEASPPATSTHPTVKRPSGSAAGSRSRKTPARPAKEAQPAQADAAAASPAAATPSGDTPAASAPTNPAATPTVAAPPQSEPATTQAATTPSNPQNQPATLQHAMDAKMGRCTPLIRDAVTFTSALPQAGAMSTWSKDQPDEHMFQSIIGLEYASALGPKAAAILVASPDKTGCEASFVQVHPTSRSCAEIEGSLRKAGVALASLSGLPVTQADNAPRQLLLPAPKGGCVVVGIGMEKRQN